MPLHWVGTPDNEAPEISGASCHAAGEPPLAVLHLWPHRSLPRRGFVLFFALSFALVLVPLLAFLGTPVLWGLLPFFAATLGLTWWLMEKSYRDGEVLEELRLWSDRAALMRLQRGRAPQTWDANPYWVSVQVHPKGGPVESYLTLKGAGREVEIGAFLSKDEREALYPVLGELIQRAAASAHLIG